MKLFSASKLHPTTWWVLGISLAVFAGLSTSIWQLCVLIILCVVITLACRENSPWSKSLKFYLLTALVVVVIRIVFRILFSFSGNDQDVVLNLPTLQFNLGLGEVTFLGPITWTALNGAIVDGLRLAGIILSIGLANTLANPRKLLKSTPSALYEIATAISVAINLAPQMIDSLNRVRRARTLRGRSTGLRSLAGTVIPVLEDTIERSLALAASMDARGFGRRGKQSAAQRVTARLLALGGLSINLIGIYLLLTEGGLLALAAICAGLLMAAASIRLTARRKVRTTYSKQPRNWRDVFLYLASMLIVLSGVAIR